MMATFRPPVLSASLPPRLVHPPQARHFVGLRTKGKAGDNIIPIQTATSKPLKVFVSSLLSLFFCSLSLTVSFIGLTIDIYPYHGDPTTSYVTSPYSPTNSYSTSDYMEATSSIHKSLPSPTGTVFPARSAPHSSPSYPCSEAQSSMMTAFLLTPQTTYFSKFWGNLHAEPADNEGVHTFM